MLPDILCRGKSWSFFLKCAELNKEFNEPIPRPPSGQEMPQKLGLKWGYFNSLTSENIEIINGRQLILVNPFYDVLLAVECQHNLFDIDL